MFNDIVAKDDTPDGIGLYIHVPFCESKCFYCDFNSYAWLEDLIPSYVDALVREIAQWGRLLGRPTVNTVFFGGGTPSYIPAPDLEVILNAARAAFRVAPDAEITMEANPGDLTFARTPPLPALGINRLSLGVQSLDDGLLDMLGRRHTASEAQQALAAARATGLSNVSIDLMYGLPSQTLAQWRHTVEGAVELAPEHLSVYCLTLEGGTPMEHQVNCGELALPDPDLAADMYLLAEELLGQAGYHRYEISNWAKPGCESAHNLTYWRNRQYLGVGPGAHSYLANNRFYNVLSPREYVARLAARVPDGPAAGPLSIEILRRALAVAEVEPIDRRMEMAETMMMGLRLAEGVSVEAFKERFGEDVEAVYGRQITEVCEFGLLEKRDGALRLTDRGYLLGNEVFGRFLEAD